MTIPCAICKKPIDPTATDWIPFCSERCKLIDLSHWLDGDYRIPGAPADLDALDDDPRVDHGRDDEP